ncbi:MAG: hypothetical protein RLY20_3326, partial [Verrucomicrobiota bacterium]
TVDAFTTTTLQFPSGTHPLSLPSGGNYVNSSSVSYQVDAGASVTASNALGSSAALTLNGTLTINGAATFTGPNTVGSAGVFRINFNGGTVPTAVWPTGSRVEVLGATTASPGGLEQTLNDLTWDSAAQSQAINMTLASTMTVNGTLHLKNSNAKEVRLTSSGTPTVSVGTLHVESGILTASSGLGQTTLNVTNNLAIDSGATLKAAGGAGMSAINLVGTLSNSGTLNLALNRTNTPSATKLSNAGTINAGGTLTVQNNGPTPQNGDIFDLFDGTLSGTFATVNLPTGGTTHWDTSDLYVGGTIKFTNAAPAASDLGLGVSVGGTATAIVIGKFATDADGDTLTITSVSSPTSGTATISGGNVIYTNTAAAASDSFTYTVSDGVGGTATKTVTVTISSPEGYNKLSGPTPVGGGQYQLDYLGIPGQQYALDETSSLAPPITWTPLLTNTAAGNGSITFTVTPANPSGFFRTRSVP